MADLTQEDVQTILKILDEMGDRDVHLEIGELKLHVTRGGDGTRSMSQPAMPVAAPPSPTVVSQVQPGHLAVRAPTIGTFYREIGRAHV